ncbi:uncharacterized protein LOC125030702 [Penaeus chinensis]|uniref:uncharacterized protein LOC125030702 n=1 Tax=Penaeus chinensis TaxID=139456 RepID=UPI001FB735F5|nr:uncharacterized protein LOC125030702 [Penaeus chinensis]
MPTHIMSALLLRADHSCLCNFPDEVADYMFPIWVSPVHLLHQLFANPCQQNHGVAVLFSTTNNSLLLLKPSSVVSCRKNHMNELSHTSASGAASATLELRGQTVIQPFHKSSNQLQHLLNMPFIAAKV